ncbi:hypothetical protein EVAR_86105_1 [Eumeta japonica]|uniref:Uncharacterized protein n=1 Tax=Eumeta variegata TaxID=151549 RepID=A0A4C1V0I9_EUMVA|nr:hypothetical protein EVAR_86105_1 [Eumeta japonica]
MKAEKAAELGRVFSEVMRDAINSRQLCSSVKQGCTIDRALRPRTYAYENIRRVMVYCPLYVNNMKTVSPYRAEVLQLRKTAYGQRPVYNLDLINALQTLIFPHF